jgi:hypothetical protein
VSFIFLSNISLSFLQTDTTINQFFGRAAAGGKDDDEEDGDDAFQLMAATPTMIMDELFSLMVVLL